MSKSDVRWTQSEISAAVRRLEREERIRRGEFSPAECMGTARHGPHEFNGGMYCPGLGEITYVVEDFGELPRAGSRYTVLITDVSATDDISQNICICMKLEDQ